MRYRILKIANLAKTQPLKQLIYSTNNYIMMIYNSYYIHIIHLYQYLQNIPVVTMIGGDHTPIPATVIPATCTE